jgi:hypothetical protein
MAKPSDGGVQQPSDHIEQIRDIILGPHKRQYDQRLEQMAANVQKTQAEVHAHTEDACAALQKRLEEKLADTTADLVTRVQKLNEANLALQQQLREAESKLQADVRTLRDQISSELDSHVSTLRDSKVSKEDMADLLQEMALKLKGVEVLEELKKAVRRTPRE